MTVVQQQLGFISPRSIKRVRKMASRLNAIWPEQTNTIGGQASANEVRQQMTRKQEAAADAKTVPADHPASNQEALRSSNDTPAKHLPSAVYWCNHGPLETVLATMNADSLKSQTLVVSKRYAVLVL